MTFYLQPLDHEILLALAWAAPLTTLQLHRLVAAHMDCKAFRKRLCRLKGHEVVQSAWYYRPVPRRPPERIGWVWSLTVAGFKVLVELGRQVGEHRQQPPHPAAIRHSLLEHDLALSELVVRLVERARPFLSGIYLDREIKLDALRRRPICDAILIIRRSLPHALCTTVPWLTGPPAPQEAIRGYAVEVDRDNEAIGIIREKAVAYRTVWQDSDFYRRYGRFPVPLWLVPRQRRLEAIMSAWGAVWPEGKWLISTDDGLKADRFEEWMAGARRTRTLLDGWELQPAELIDETGEASGILEATRHSGSRQ